MPSKMVSALAAGALLVATSSAFAQTASTPSVNTAALLQGGVGETEGSTVLIVTAVLASIGLLIWATGDDNEPEAVSPN